MSSERLPRTGRPSTQAPNRPPRVADRRLRDAGLCPASPSRVMADSTAADTQSLPQREQKLAAEEPAEAGSKGSCLQGWPRMTLGLPAVKCTGPGRRVWHLFPLTRARTPRAKLALISLVDSPSLIFGTEPHMSRAHSPMAEVLIPAPTQLSAVSSRSIGSQCLEELLADTTSEPAPRRRPPAAPPPCRDPGRG